MVMPLLSVTFIGLVLGAALSATSGLGVGAVLVRSVMGAWLGFLCGGVAGVLVDILMGSGATLAILGHAGAGAGTVLAARPGQR